MLTFKRQLIRLAVSLFLGLALGAGPGGLAPARVEAQPERAATAMKWTKISEGMFGGSITAVAFSPAFAADHIALAGTSEGGIFKSTNSGDWWYDVSKGLWNKQMKAVVFSPAFATDQTVFCGALHAGVNKSTACPA